MTPKARQTILDVAAEHFVAPSLIIAKCRLPRVYRARAEVARRLHAFGYSSNKIGRCLRHDHTTILYYLGNGKRRPKQNVLMAWHPPRIAHLHCRGCYLCRTTPKDEAKRKRRPVKRVKAFVVKFLVPYAGADWTYEWKERRGDNKNAPPTVAAGKNPPGSRGSDQADLHRDQWRGPDGAHHRDRQDDALSQHAG